MKPSRTLAAAAFAVSALSWAPSASAQWPNHKTDGIPRTADGKPDLAAPAPRTADGKPDLTGVWLGQGMNYSRNIAGDLQPGYLQPWAEALYQERVLNFGKDGPVANCLPSPPVFFHLRMRIVQTPALLALLSESDDGDGRFRTIFTDGRGLPKDPNPTWLGYSVGRWEGDTLIVDTTGFNDSGWLDSYGHPRSEALRITERFRRRDFGHMDFDMTIDDPKVFTKAFTIKMNKTLAADTELQESVCENARIAPHLVGGNGLRLSPEVLARYAGNYEIGPGREVAVTARGLLLFLQQGVTGERQPLVPRTETTFVLRGSGDEVEFAGNVAGTVTHLIMHRRGGTDLQAVRKGNVLATKE